MAVNERELLSRIGELAPFGGEEQARLALRATLSALGRGLTSDEASALAEELGGEWVATLSAARFEGELSLEEFYRRAALEEGRRLGVATEHAQVVCRALSELLPRSALARLRRHLPPLEELFRSPEALAAPPAPYHLRATPAEEHTLAGGKPGGSQPLSAARPGSRHPLADAKPEVAHAHSVARSDDPHGDTKLSGSKGLTQERENESLSRSQRSVRR